MMGKTVIMVIAMRMVVVEDALVADPLSAAAVPCSQRSTIPR